MTKWAKKCWRTSFLVSASASERPRACRLWRGGRSQHEQSALHARCGRPSQVSERKLSSFRCTGEAKRSPFPRAAMGHRDRVNIHAGRAWTRGSRRTTSKLCTCIGAGVSTFPSGFLPSSPWLCAFHGRPRFPFIRFESCIWQSSVSRFLFSCDWRSERVDVPSSSPGLCCVSEARLLRCFEYLSSAAPRSFLPSDPFSTHGCACPFPFV